jgi:hypothetical protein
MAGIPEGCFENSPARSTATCGEKAPIVPAPRGGASNHGFRFDAPPRGAESKYPCTPHVAALRAGLFSLCPRWGRQAAMRLLNGFRSAADPVRVTSVNKKQGTREQGTGIRDQRSGNREQRSGNRDQGTEIREQRSGNRDQGTDRVSCTTDRKDRRRIVPSFVFLT